MRSENEVMNADFASVPKRKICVLLMLSGIGWDITTPLAPNPKSRTWISPS